MTKDEPSVATEGRAEVAVAMRQLEVRIGQLLGPANSGGDRKSDQFTREVTDLTPNERRDFRQMAAHPEVVAGETVGRERRFNEGRASGLSVHGRPPERRSQLLKALEEGLAPLGWTMTVAEHQPCVFTNWSDAEREQARAKARDEKDNEGGGRVLRGGRPVLRIVK